MYVIEYADSGIYVCLDMADGSEFAAYDSEDPNSEYANVTDFVRVCLDQLWELGLIQDISELTDFELSDFVQLMRALEKPAGGVFIDNWIKTKHGYGYA